MIDFLILNGSISSRKSYIEINFMNCEFSFHLIIINDFVYNILTSNISIISLN